MLNNFQDLIPNELPKELSLMRDIQYAIDLVLGASLPNLPVYCISPTKNVKLKRQVNELLQKDYI